MSLRLLVALLVIASAGCGSKSPSAAQTPTTTTGTAGAAANADGLTEQDRKMIIEIARRQETKPDLEDPDVKNALGRISAAGFDVVICADLIMPLVADPNDFPEDLGVLLVLSSAAFMVENPAQADDLRAVATASIRSLLRGYIASQRPAGLSAARMKELAGRDAAGTLRGFVDEGWAGCPKTSAEAKKLKQPKSAPAK